MRLRLAWEGPWGAGRFPAEPAVVERLQAPGVYLRIKRYGGGRTVSYVGQSRSVLARMDQHLTAMMSLQTPLRDERGQAAFTPDAGSRMAAYNDLARWVALAAEEAGRTRFYVALCDGEAFAPDRLGLVEGALKARIEAHLGAGAGLGACENVQGIAIGPLDEPVAIEHDTGLLDAAGAAALEAAFGAGPILLDAV